MEMQTIQRFEAVGDGKSRADVLLSNASGLSRSRVATLMSEGQCRLNEKTLEFLAGQHLHLPSPLGRQLTAHSRVASDQVLLHRLIQRCPTFGVTHSHHPIGQTFPKLFCAGKPPLLFQVGIELLEVLLGQLAQRNLAQLRDDMLIDGTLISVLRGGTETGLDVGLIPEVHPLSEGHIGADLLGLGAAHCFHQLGQLFLALVLGLGQHILRFGQRKNTYNTRSL